MIKTSRNGICDDGKSRVLYKDDDVRSKTVGQFFVKKKNKTGNMKLVLYKPLDNKRAANKQKGGMEENFNEFKTITSEAMVRNATEFNAYVGKIEQGQRDGIIYGEFKLKMCKEFLYFGYQFNPLVNYIYTNREYPYHRISGTM